MSSLLPGRRSLGSSVLDQAISSGTNFSLLLLAAGALDAKSFGRLSVAFVFYQLILGATRAYCFEQLLVDVPRLRGSGEVGCLMARSSRGTFIAAGLGSSVALSFGVTIYEESQPLLLAFAVTLPGLLLHERERVAALAFREVDRAVVLDLLWLLLGLLALITMRVTLPGAGAAAYLLAWAVPAALAVLIVRPRSMSPSDGGDCDARPSRAYLVEFISAAGATHLSLFLAALAAGPELAGVVRLGSTLYGPVSVATAGALLYLVPHARSPGAYRDASVTAAAITAGCLALGLGYWVVPQEVGTRFFGETFVETQNVVPLLSLAYVLLSVAQVNFALMRGNRIVHRTLVTRLALAPVALLFPWVLGATAGARGYVAGLAIAQGAAAVAWIVNLYLLRGYLRGTTD